MTDPTLLVADDDITQENTSGYQVLQTTDVTLTAGQFQGFSSIVSANGNGGAINAATSGVYDLEGKSTERFALFAQYGASTTLIGNDAAGEILGAFESGDDTLEAGNGADDVVYSGSGVDTLIGGNGGDTYEISWGATTVIGGSGDDTFVLGEYGVSGSSADVLQGGSGRNTLSIEAPRDNLSGVRISGIQTLEISAIVGLTAAEFAAFSTIEARPVDGWGGTSLFTTTGGTYDLEGKSTQCLNMSAASDAGTTLIGNDAAGESLAASGSGDDTLQAGNGADDVLFSGSGLDTLIGGNGGDTFVIDSEPLSRLHTGDQFEGGSGENTLLVDAVSENIGSAAISGIQNLELTSNITLTATQFAEFSTIDLLPADSTDAGTISAETSGVYDLEGKSSERFDLTALAYSGTTLIGNDANGEVLSSFGFGYDVLQAGNGAQDTLDSKGGYDDVLIAGSGMGDVLFGGSGANRFVFSNFGSAEAYADGGTSLAVFSGDKASYTFSVSFANGQWTTIVTNRTTGSVDTLHEVQELEFADARATPFMLAGGVTGLLTDPTVGAAVFSVLNNNTLTYQGMLTVFKDVAAQGSLTHSELSSLAELVRLLNVPGGIAVSGYVQSITASIVGAEAASSASNLANGSSASQQRSLIGEWFLGTDLPSLTGFSNIAYENAASPLYGPSDAPLYTDVNQGELGDCYLMASLGECALMEPELIESMITNNGNGTYGVRFYVNNQAVYVTVNTSLPYFTTKATWADGSQLAFANGPQIWAALIEKAFVELNAEPGATGENGGNAYEDIAGGYAKPISLMTGKKISTYIHGDYTADSWSSDVLDSISRAFQSGEEVLVGTAGAIADSTRFVANHMFEVIGYNSATKLFTLYNPWGGAVPTSTPRITFTASMADLYNNNCDIYAASGNTTLPAPTLSLEAGQFAANGASVTLTGSIDALDANLTITIVDDGPALVSVAPASTGAWKAVVTLPAVTGRQFISAEAINASGTEVQSNSLCRDTAADIESLTPDEIANLSYLNDVTEIAATDASVVLDIAQAVALVGNHMTIVAPAGDAVTLSDSGSDIASLTADQAFQLAAGGYGHLNATSAANLSVNDAQLLSSARLSVVGSSMTLVDSAAQIETLSAQQIAGLSKLDVTGISATDAGVALSVAQAVAWEAANLAIGAPQGDAATVSDTAAHIETLTAQQIEALSRIGVTALDATDANVAFSAVQTAAILAAGLAVAATGADSVTETFLNGDKVYIDGQMTRQTTVNADRSYETVLYKVTNAPYSTCERLFTAAGANVATAYDDLSGAGSLTLSGANLTVASGPGELRVTEGVDTFNLDAHSHETLTATGARNDTFVLTPGSGAGAPAWSDTLAGFLGQGATHDTLEFSAAALGAAAGATRAADLATLFGDVTRGAAGNAVITDVYGDTLTLAGVSAATFKSFASTDFRFV